MHRKIFVRMCLALCSVILCLSVVTKAQVNTATISGTVVDPQGLGVKGATITLENPATGAQRTADADDDGHYTIVGVTPGRYRMTVEGGAGFGKYENRIHRPHCR